MERRKDPFLGDGVSGLGLLRSIVTPLSPVEPAGGRSQPWAGRFGLLC